ncbi:transcription initiation factor IIE, alpha subunit, putative [Plasmodium knowlesi strain H]|uniref:Transcription initiation factor IIE, alpha subunit, putative n=3 Tax=Plasmodium knowlesi TaxID=5850 RepID=A0A5K1VFE1_PLAKH|nr:transcription initiation factor IIE subunit alpha, putative [Plasmodium knowlesi strain H]OTN68581.1 putative Transcription initiation factor IIE - alpha subunit [Plasmodium knowlesi]CAA9986547.1 transcription initiation factor IIE subunit alpha, putative [Plasmodium knowlesi strain H]SBO24186.1 transcription initiation factor IIE, alpha subunit, putative [Plasmodium knowlesi strain H]SBO29793.1 transcription initiation factor IIE, alpha subunit, putative [Plasmodium knowlesi strain H]VVS76|eukprot:XP_002261096.1 transcription initiation factor IIE, alpha subunit, putative [Plasmodium knowlesi strain H]
MEKSKEIFYDKEKRFFLHLMIYVSRFFLNDDEIVVFDLFVHNECLYLEKDIINSLNMNEQKIRSILSKLLKEKFIIQVQKLKTTERGSTFQVYYCLNNYIVYVIDYRIREMEVQLRKDRNDNDMYVCNFCKATYSQLDAQLLPLDSYDAHFLCFCNNKIELVEKDESNHDRIYNRYTKYINILKEHTEKLKNYFIPLYTEKFSRVVPNSLHSLAADNSSDESMTNNSSELSLTNNSSQVSQNNPGKLPEQKRAKNEETPTDTCSSVIRSDKKIKICMNVKGKKGTNKVVASSTVGKTTSPEKDQGEDNIEQKGHITGRTKHKSADLAQVQQSTSEMVVLKDSLKTNEPEMPLFFIEKFKKEFSLMDAQKLQQDMTQDEFERFMELQDEYLDLI